MRIGRTGCFLALTMVCAGAAQAQGNLGELLDMGGKQVAKGELVSLIVGASMSGDSFGLKGGGVRFDYRADGTVTGIARNAAGQEFQHTGTWNVDDAGRFCRETTVMPANVRKSECRFFFVKANEYFAAESNTDRGATVFKRLFEKK